MIFVYGLCDTDYQIDLVGFAMLRNDKPCNTEIKIWFKTYFFSMSF